MLGTLSQSSVDLVLLVLRLSLGAVFLAHGINHIYGGGGLGAAGLMATFWRPTPQK